MLIVRAEHHVPRGQPFLGYAAQNAVHIVGGAAYAQQYVHARCKLLLDFFIC